MSSLTTMPAMPAAPATPGRPERLRFIKPTLPEWSEVEALYRDAYRSGTITNGETVAKFESAVAERIGVRHCVAVSSCTSGLILGMKALGLKGEVIMPSFTFFATGMAALWSGLKPVFADCDPHTWSLDAADVANRVTPNTAAIIGVHMYGNPCNVEALTAVAAASNCALVFDSAHGFGSSHDGIPVGAFGDFEVFSLSPTKLLVAGEGGLVTTNDSGLAHRLRAARNYGDLGAYDPILQGQNARMPEFNAALGLAGLDLVDEKVARHNEIARLYDSELQGLPGISFQKTRPGDVCSYKDYSIHLDPSVSGVTRDELAIRLAADGFDTKKYFYPPLHQQQIFQSYQEPGMAPLPVTDFVSGGVLSLPVYHSLPDRAIRQICEAVQRGVAA